MNKYFIYSLLLFTVTFLSCNNSSSSHDAHDHNHNHETEEAHSHDCSGHSHDKETHAEAGESHSHDAHEESSSSDEIVFSPQKAKEVGLVSQVIEPKSFRQVIQTSGEILPAQGNESMVVANIAGIISFNHPVTAGMSVKKGASILSINSNNLPDGDPVLRARNIYQTAKSEYERAGKLVKSQIISQKEYNRIKESYENARLSYEAISTNSTNKGVSIVSPMSGYVKTILVNEGDYVSVGQPLVSVTQTNRLYLRADVSERYYKDLVNIKSANFKTPYSNNVYKLDSLKGRLLSYGKASGENSYFIPVTFEFDNKGDVVPGSFVNIYLLSSNIPNVLSLPNSAITEEQGLYFIYKKLDEECYIKQEVKLGMNNGDEVQILSGLHPGDNVVVKGAYQLKLASATNAIPAHSHEH